MEPHGLAWVLMQTNTCHSDSGASAHLKQSFFAKISRGGNDLSRIHNLKVPVHKIQFCFMMSVVEFQNYSFVLWRQIQQTSYVVAIAQTQTFALQVAPKIVLEIYPT